MNLWRPSGDNNFMISVEQAEKLVLAEAVDYGTEAISFHKAVVAFWPKPLLLIATCRPLTG